MRVVYRVARVPVVNRKIGQCLAVTSGSLWRATLRPNWLKWKWSAVLFIQRLCSVHVCERDCMNSARNKHVHITYSLLASWDTNERLRGTRVSCETLSGEEASKTGESFVWSWDAYLASSHFPPRPPHHPPLLLLLALI